MIKERNIAVCIILSILTCGIYGIYWMITLTNEIKQITGNQKLQSGGMSFLLILVTCGIYSFIWAYQLGGAITEYKRNKGLPFDENNATLFLVLSIFGLTIVNYFFAQTFINEVAAPKQDQQPTQPQN